MPRRPSSPRFSIVVPVYRVQGYLRECLDSVLSQSYGDFELIAVDDRSPDHCGAIIDAYAARDERVVPVHLESNVGLGRARNAGIERARGAYLLFLDSDDTYTPGTLAAIARRIDDSGAPDIVVFDYARTYWWGKTERNALASVLADAGDDVFTAAERPEVLELLMVVWNKAYRRDFVAATGLTFPPGYYEDTPWTFPAMLSAGRIAALDRVCVHYRQRRQGNILRTTSRKHFDILDQYDRVFAFLADHPELRRWHGFLYRKMAEHCVDVLGRTHRIPAEARRDFFRLAGQRFRAHRPAVPAERPGSLTMKRRLIGWNAYLLFQLLKFTNGRRVRWRKKLRARRRRWVRGGTRRYYRSRLRRPLDPCLAVYSAYWNRGVQCNPAAIAAKAAELAPHVHAVWVVRKDAVDTVPAGVEYVIQGSRPYWDVMARATYFVSNVNFPDSVVKRPGQIHLQTHHGTPVKTMGADQRRYPAVAAGVSVRGILKRADRWDFSVSSNPHSSEIWDRAYPCAYTCLETGYPRNDVYFTTGADGVRARRRMLGIPDGRTAVLYAPTHRDYESGYRARLDLARLAEELGPDFVLLVRAHYYYGPVADEGLSALRQQGRILDVSTHHPVEDLCLAADALITDYSSVMFDYACLDRPIIVHADDWDTYTAVRGVYFDLLSGRPGDTPGVVTTTLDELVAALRSGEFAAPEATRLRAAFRQRFCAYDDGLAAERVVRRVFLGETELAPVTPLALRTPAPAPASSPGGVLQAAGTGGLEE